MKRGAIFDMDGTLLDTEKVYQEGWHDVALEFGEEPSWELAHLESGASGPYMYETVKRFYPNVDPHEYVEHVIAYMQRKTAEHIDLMPGVTEILSFFKENDVRLAVASSSPREIIKANLDRVGVLDYFEVIVAGEEVAHGKPSPDIFLKAAELLKLPPEDCYVFEDSLNGMRAGAAAKCAAVMIPDQVAPTDEIRALATAIYPSLTDALTAIKRQSSKR